MATKYKRPSLRDANPTNDPTVTLDPNFQPRDPGMGAGDAMVRPKISEAEASMPWLYGGPGSYENSQTADAAPGNLGNVKTTAMDYVKYLASQQGGAQPTANAAVAPGGTAQGMAAGPVKDPNLDMQAQALQSLLAQQDQASKQAMQANQKNARAQTVQNLLGNIKQPTYQPVVPGGFGNDDFTVMLRSKIYGR